MKLKKKRENYGNIFVKIPVKLLNILENISKCEKKVTQIL